MSARLLFDIEGDGLLPELTTIHCLAAVDPDTGWRGDWKPEEVGQALEVLSKADRLYAHNGLRYDFPALEKVKGFKVPAEKQGDTFVISRLMFPDLKGSDGKLVEAGKLDKELHGKHSVKAWGQRLGEHKGDYEGGWERWSQEMHDYMVQDVTTLWAIWKHFDPDSYSQQAIELEHRIARLTDLMETEGWPFDEQAAARLHIELLSKHAALEKALVEEFGCWYAPKKTDEHGCPVEFTPKRPNAKLGYWGEWADPSEAEPAEGVDDLFAAEVAKAKKPKQVFHGYPCTPVDFVTFNPSSRQHITRCLKLRGWRPTEFTQSGLPKLDDAVLESLADKVPAASSLVEYLLLDKRIGQLATGDKAWLKQVGPDGRMHGGYNPMGTATSRAAHFRPNLGQVPAVKSLYGHECRSLFTVPKGWKLIGADQSGLQLRNLGHYLAPFDGGAYGAAVASGDPHWRACIAMGLVEQGTERDKGFELHSLLREAGGKRATYATVFGCHDKKFGSVIRDACVLARTKNPEWGFVFDRYFGRGETDREVGEEWRQKFYDALGLEPLIKKLHRILKQNHRWKGHLPGLDGRWVPCRSDHSALNYLLQSAEGIICKRWITDAFDALVAKGLKHGWTGDFVFVGWVHDEVQVACREGLEDTVAQTLVEHAQKAGEPYGFRVKLASEAKIGRNWAETH